MASGRFRDLPAGTRVFIAATVGAGSLMVAQSSLQLFLQWPGRGWALLALLTLVSGSATVNLPSLPAAVSVSETFVFTAVLLFGPAAGTITVLLDALVISFWSYRKGQRIYKIIFNVCAVSLTLWMASHLYYVLAQHKPIATLPDNEQISIQAILWPLLAFTAVYYFLNTGLVTAAIALERRTSPIRIWRENFVGLALNYFGGASVAALLANYRGDLDYRYILIVVPLLVVLYFTFSSSMGRVEDQNRHLSQLNTLYMSTIETLAMAIDAKDQITHGHIRRVQLYAVGLAKSIGVKDESLIRAIEAAALLHDMGKLAVPEYILNKPGPLTPAEFEKMKLHASVGADILSAIDFPYPVVPIVRHHHENWNGTGYPDKIAGSDIPIGARILSVVDCFDALTSDRPYRPRLSDKEALRILHERRGTMYDPLVVDTFARVYKAIAPSETPESQASSLRAITEAAGAPTVLTEPRSTRLEEIAASSDEMLTLFDLARTLTPSMGVQDATELIAKHLRRLIPSSSCVFYLYDTDSDELLATHVSGEHSAHMKGLRVPRGQRLSGWVAANRQTIRNSDPVLDLGESARAMNPRPRSCLAAPLVSGKTLVGVLTLYSSNKDAYSEEHQRVIEVIARQVSSTILEAQDTETHRSRSLRDETTGLPNLVHLLEFVEAQLEGEDKRHPLSLVSVTFAISADSTPEAATEAVIAAMRKAVRPADLLFRTASDELVALLLNTERPAASAVRMRIDAALRALRDARVIAACSIGQAFAPTDSHKAEALLDISRNRRSEDDSDFPPTGAVH
jgi:putative nucleotidyltransferase with HDIG domain